MRRILVLASVGLSVSAAVGNAQMPDGSANRAAIGKLEFMVGRWTGEAWMQRGPERVHTTMTETVERKLDGVVLQVEGRGIIPAAAGGEPRVVHHAFAVISFEAQAGAYGLRSYLANGLFGDFALTLIPGGVSWSREVPGGRVRNTARIANDEWHEVGEFSRDGVTWTQIMEMRLRRQP
jgi:hypothetical protein